MIDLQKLNRIANWLDVVWTPHQIELFSRFEVWLTEEAVVAGGIGPHEVPRILDRHIADSLSFLRLADDATKSLIDVGSGVGLPAIPIAIARPKVAVTILDRSVQRTHLAARAVRVLDLSNTKVVTGDWPGVKDRYDLVAFRGSLRLDAAVTAFRHLAVADGVGIFALTRRGEPPSIPEPPDNTIFSVVSEGAEVLDSPAWLLRMQRSR